MPGHRAARASRHFRIERRHDAMSDMTDMSALPRYAIGHQFKFHLMPARRHERIFNMPLVDGAGMRQDVIIAQGVRRQKNAEY